MGRHEAGRGGHRQQHRGHRFRRELCKKEQRRRRGGKKNMYKVGGVQGRRERLERSSSGRRQTNTEATLGQTAAASKIPSRRFHLHVFRRIWSFSNKQSLKSTTVCLQGPIFGKYLCIHLFFFLQI